MALERLKQLMVESYQNILTETVVYVKPAEIPEGIRNWVRQVSGKNIQKYRVDQSGSDLHIGMPTGTGDKVYYQHFKLTEDGNAVPMGNTVTRVGWESESPQDYQAGVSKTGTIPIPPGYVVVKCRTSYYGDMVDIYTSKGATLFLPQDVNADEFTDEELIILITTKSYKSFARPKFQEHHYERLIAKGYLNKAKAITINGRNLLSQPEVKEKVKQAVDRWNSKRSFGSGYLSLNLFE